MKIYLTDEINEGFIQNIIAERNRNKGHKMIVPNSRSACIGEADLISVTDANVRWEYEIKCSLADFKADFKKVKHRYFQDVETAMQVYHKSIPNYFVFVSLPNLIPIKMIPEYAGLIYLNMENYESSNQWRFIDSYYKLKLVRKPPKLHDYRTSPATLKSLSKSLMFRYWRQRGCAI